jgi:hypothetical protein
LKSRFPSTLRGELWRRSEPIAGRDLPASAVAIVLVILLPNDELGPLPALRIACHPGRAGKSLKLNDIFLELGSRAKPRRPFLAGPAEFAGLFTAR